MSSAERVQNRVEARQDGEYVSPQTELLYVCGGSKVVVRPAGAIVESLSLTDKTGRSNKVHDILYSDDKVGTAKRRASHIMSPAGKFEGLGGQHGAGRWLDWHTFKLDPKEWGKQIAFQAKREDLGETLLRNVRLGERQAWFDTAVIAPYETDLHTSIGEHWYFKMSGDLKDVAIDGKSLEMFTHDEEVYDKIGRGEAVHVPMKSTLNVWAIELPGQPSIKMETQLFSASGFVPSELWIWREEGADDYLCIEPVVGVIHDENGQLENDLLTIEAGHEATLRTTISLL
jgi:galactose mutarotase-like enzyme